MNQGALRIVFGVLMVALAVLYSLPQWWRSRKGSNEGVSLASVTNLLVSVVAWLIFAIALRDPWVLLSNCAVLPALIATTVVLVRHGASRSGMWTTVFWAGLLLLGAAVAPWSAVPISLLLGCAIFWYVGPAVWTAWTSPDVSGIAPGAWLVVLADAAVWATYAWITHILAIAIYCAVAGAGSLLILGRIRWRRPVAAAYLTQE
jgi:uncharacterized protein with PQ loop repeat